MNKIKILILCHCESVIIMNGKVKGHWLSNLIQKIQNMYCVYNKLINCKFEYYTVDPVVHPIKCKDNPNHFKEDAWSDSFLSKHNKEYNIVFMPDCGGIWNVSAIRDDEYEDNEKNNKVKSIIEKSMSLVSDNGILMVSKISDIVIDYLYSIFNFTTHKEYEFNIRYLIIKKNNYKLKDINKSVQDVCKSPNISTLSKLNSEELDIFYEASKKVMKLKQTESRSSLNFKLANLVINFKENRRYQCLDNMGICEEITKNNKEPFEKHEFIDKHSCYHSCVSDNKERFRVRTILPYISYTELNKNKILPSKPMFTEGFSDIQNKMIKIPTRGGSFPKMAKKVGYPFFGVFVDMYIRASLLNRSIPTLDKIYSVYNEAANTFHSNSPINIKDISSEIEYFNDIGRWILSKVKYNDKVTIEPEWTYGKVQGHPDLIINDIIYDIKTTGAWTRMRSETILQVLSYYCLGKLLNKGTKKIGIILPCQKMIISVDLTGWKWKSFWKELNIGINNMKPPMDMNVMMMYMSQVKPYVGSHIEKFNGKVWKTVEQYNRNTPLQIFVSPPLGGDITETDSDTDKTYKIIRNKNIKLFIHAPYVINLCREEGCIREKVFVKNVEKKCKYNDWIPAEQLKRQLRVGKKMNCKGVVVHLGKKVNMDISIAVAHMFMNIEDAAQEATLDCPLLLETGAGVEVLSDVYALVNFYKNLPDETKKVTKICLDTCHVFASGFMPYDALMILVQNKCPIGLIHFNDSKYPLNSRKDRHAPVGYGLIPLEQLYYVGLYAIKNNIPLVHE
jgi:deoxyribonuclease-4